MTEAWSVPVVDISAFVDEGSDKERKAVVAQVDEVNTNIGFMQVTGHGIPNQTLRALAGAMDSFFELPPVEKQPYRAAPNVSRGYSPPRSESLSLSLGVSQQAGAYDLFEAFNIGTAVSDFAGIELSADQYPENIWPADSDGFKIAVEAYFAEAGRVARVLTSIFARALELPIDYFDAFTDHSVDVLRLNHYSLPKDVQVAPFARGMGEHTDFGIVTVLWADQIPGLQVLSSDGVWRDVMPTDGALLVNLGDLTARWTNDRWCSTMHRVMPPVIDGQLVRRRSAAFFHDGNIDACIATLASCRASDGSSHYVETTVEEHLAQKLGGSRAGVANTQALREANRLATVRSSERAIRLE